MTTDERIAVLEAELADLQRRLDLVEREHKRLLGLYGPLAEDREKQKTERDETYTLFTDSVDERIAELAGRTGGGGGPQFQFGASSFSGVVFDCSAKLQFPMNLMS
jgi:hypothetical protein